MTRTFRIAFLSLLIAQSLALFLLEGFIPLPFLAPGAKLGLANIVTVFALYTLPSTRDVFLLLAIRTFLASLFGGGPTVFLYSIAGGFTSLVAMCFLKRSGRFSVFGVSAAGGFFHNVGQLAVAAWVMQTQSIWLYLPILGVCGVLTGCIIGAIGGLLLKRWSR